MSAVTRFKVIGRRKNSLRGEFHIKCSKIIKQIRPIAFGPGIF